jgi:hypothetical protein
MREILDLLNLFFEFLNLKNNYTKSKWNSLTGYMTDVEIVGCQVEKFIINVDEIIIYVDFP